LHKLLLSTANLAIIIRSFEQQKAKRLFSYIKSKYNSLGFLFGLLLSFELIRHIRGLRLLNSTFTIHKHIQFTQAYFLEIQAYHRKKSELSTGLNAIQTPYPLLY